MLVTMVSGCPYVADTKKKFMIAMNSQLQRLCCWRWRTGTVIFPKRFRRSASVILEGDLDRVQHKTEKRFTKLMREKYGIGYGGQILHQPKVKLEFGAKMHGRVDPKKLNILSKHLMQSICDILASGELTEDTSALQDIQISKVQLTSDLQSLKIHWIATGTDEDLKTNQELESCLDSLRYAVDQRSTSNMQEMERLTTALLRLDYVGFVPKIKFVRDLSQAQLSELSRLLEQADKGEDFPRLTPLQAAYFNESELKLNLDEDPQSTDRDLDSSERLKKGN